MPGRRIPRAQVGLLVLLASAVALANIAQPYPEIAPLQHVPTIALIVVAPWGLARWPLSTASLAMTVAFFALHTLAGRYTYSNMPYDDWAMRLTGHDVSGTFGLARNGVDRVMHFCFGLLCLPPLAEALHRHGGQRPGTAPWIALSFIVAAGAVYEIFEWALTMVAAPDMAADYNGQQGDPWDAQKDMALALAGGAVAASVLRIRGRAVARAASCLRRSD